MTAESSVAMGPLPSLRPSERAETPFPAVLPPEVEEFLRAPAPVSLTVRGAPGVGKTTFALSVLAEYAGPRFFISTRVPLASLHRQFDWLATPTEPPIHLLEMVRFRSVPSSGALSVEHLRRTLQARASDLVDVSSVLNLPGELQSELDSGPPSHPLVVLDSWEAWVENILGSSAINLDVPTTRWELERSLLDQLLASGASVMMVVERADRTRFDYISDGAVLLTGEDLDGRTERSIEIAKLRGVRIRNASYLFSVDGARFRAILPPPPRVRLTPGFEPDPDPRTPGLWPGSADLARFAGRFPLPGTVLLEVDPEVPVRTVWELLAPAAEATLSEGGRVLVRPPLAVDGDLGVGELRGSLANAAEDRLRIVLPEGAAPFPTAADPVFALREPFRADLFRGSAPSREGVGAVVEHRVLAEASRFLTTGPAPDGRNLALIFVRAGRDRANPQAPDPFLLLPLLAGSRRGPVGSVVIVRSDDPFLNEARSVVSVHLALRSHRGEHLVYGIRPRTPAHVIVSASPVEPGPPFRLVALV